MFVRLPLLLWLGIVYNFHNFDVNLKIYDTIF